MKMIETSDLRIEEKKVNVHSISCKRSGSGCRDGIRGCAEVNADERKSDSGGSY